MEETHQNVHVCDPAANRTSGPFPSNTIRSTKYTPLNFIFKNLFLQFQKVANVYFLLAGVLEVIPQFTITNGTPTYLFPLVFILSVTAFKDLLEDLARRTADRQENDRLVEVYDVAIQQKFMTKKWSEVVTGDIIRLRNRDMIPADMVMVASSTAGGLVYVSTANLDGETNLKLRKVHPDINLTTTTNNKKKERISSSAQDDSDDDDNDDDDNGGTTIQDGCRALRSSLLQCELPNKYLHKFEGTLSLSTYFQESAFYDTLKKNAADSSATSTSVPLCRENVLLRSCQVRNTKWVVGVVAATGKDTKIMRNIAPAPHKTSRLMRDTNKLVGTAFVAMIVVCSICAIMSYLWETTASDAAYLSRDSVSGDVEGNDGAASAPSSELRAIYQFFTFIIIFGNFVPISLYVTLDLVKFLQSYFMMNDLDLYDELTATPMKVKSLDLNEELGSVDHIFSDKTGTLTCNIMEFMKCSIHGVSYGLGITEVGKNVLLRNGKRIPDIPEPSENDPITQNVNFIDPNIWNILKDQSHPEYQYIEEFCLSLALNHDVAPERNKYNDIIYSASSPDEAALVSAARHFGYFFYLRSTRSVTLSFERKNGQDVAYTILNILPFSSKRKRSSVIVQRPNGTIVLYCKGADNIILDKVSNDGDSYILSTSKEHVRNYSNDGLRTLMISKKELSEHEYNVWNEKYEQANLSLRDRAMKMEKIQNEIENNLTLLGVTGIEDRLQEDVSNTIASLRYGNIKVWILTGDKVDTAVNIGYACSLLTTTMNIYYVTADQNGQMLMSKNQDDDDDIDPKRLTSKHVEKRLNQILDEMVQNLTTFEHKKKECALIVDTYSLACIETGQLEEIFLNIAEKCCSVVCARVSPAQKATVVKFVKIAKPKLITLAIGDGANDVPMIQSAHIGIGISGQEGLQAVNSSDYAIGQ